MDLAFRRFRPRRIAEVGIDADRTRRRKSQPRPATSLQITRPPFGFDDPAEALQRARKVQEKP
jgi:hypothetical protein